VNISISLHLIGIVLWVGGLLGISSFLKRGDSDINAPFYGFCLPGMLLTLGTGLYQLFSKGAAYYFHQAWFHTKLIFVVVLLISTFLVWKGAKRAMPAVQILASISLIIIIFSTIFGIR
jgi:uncharacterized membrane protein